MNLKRTIFLTFMALLSVGCSESSVQRGQIDCTTPAQGQPAVIQTIEHQQNTYGTGYKIRRTADRTRDASVQVHNTERGVRGSGSYFEYDGHHIIITAAHVVEGGGGVMMISSPSGEDAKALLLYYDDRTPNDTAILVLMDPLETRIPMELDLYSKDVSNLIGEQTVYTGDPGHQRNMTIYGTVSSINADGSIILQSYAWGGASGSLVFDYKGRVVGILKAVDVNRSGVSPYPQINENVVWLSPPSSIDLTILSDTLREYELAVARALCGCE